MTRTRRPGRFALAVVVACLLALAWLAPLDGRPAPVDDAGWRDRIFAFQLASGLQADGIVGPLTLMTMARRAASGEPAF